MKVLDSISWTKKITEPSDPSYEWLAEAENELDDIIYNRYEGQRESEIIGCRIGNNGE